MNSNITCAEDTAATNSAVSFLHNTRQSPASESLFWNQNKRTESGSALKTSDNLTNAASSSASTVNIQNQAGADDACFKLLLDLAAQVGRMNDPMRYWNPSMYIETQALNPSLLEEVQGSMEGVYRNLIDCEKKIMVLGEVGGQIAAKTKELDQKTENLMLYGFQNLEPWRGNISSMTENILNGARALEAKVESTFDGYTVLEKRINWLEDELSSVKRENETLRTNYASLEVRMTQLIFSWEARLADQVAKCGEAEIFAKSVNDEIINVRMENKLEIKRLESIVIDRLVSEHRTQTEQGKEHSKTGGPPKNNN